MRTFSLAEAQTMLPVLDGLMRATIKAKETIEEIDEESEELAQAIFMNGGMLVDVVERRARKAQREQSMQIAKDAVAEMNAIGVQVKDLDIGLLDFPCNVDGEIILLCWKLGEESITHWHSTEEGYSGRKPITPKIASAESGNVQ